MIRHHLIASAVILLLGGCGSSNGDSTPDSGTPATSDSGANTKSDTTVAVADGSASDTGETNPGADAQHETGEGLADVGVKLDGTVVVDAPVEAGTPDANKPSSDTKPDTGNTTLDVAVDTAMPSIPDASPDTTPDTSRPIYDGGLGLSCIKGLFGTYVLRWDGILIDESTPASPQTVFEASTGLPLTNVVSAQQGPSHGCAALANGTVECWQDGSTGGNTYGQLGNGTTTAVTTHYRATPVLTAVDSPLKDVVLVTPGTNANYQCAITSDGMLWCWGDLSWVVKKGATLSTGYAQAITTDGAAPLTGVVSAALGPAQVCALVAGTPNTVWCWGRNVVGELGQGDKDARQYPTKVLGLTNPTKVAQSVSVAGYPDTTVCALDGDGVKCWGSNNSGAAGVNVSTTPILSPTVVVVESGAALDAVTDIMPGNFSFAVLRSNGTIWTWGSLGGNVAQKYASNYGQTNVLAIGWAGPQSSNGPRFITSDGVYHNGTSTVTVNCNAL